MNSSFGFSTGIFHARPNVSAMSQIHHALHSKHVIPVCETAIGDQSVLNKALTLRRPLTPT